MFKNTKKFQQAVSVINNIEHQKFPRVLAKLLEKMTNKKQEDQKLFEPEEADALQAFANLTEQQFSIVVEACSYVIEQALYNSLSPAKLAEQLEKAEISSDHAVGFRMVWEQMGREYLSNMKEKTLGGPTTLKEVNWRLQIQLSKSDSSREKVPNAVFEFLLGSEGTKKRDETLAVEFSKDELYTFFQKLEQIQGQLDTLS